MIVCKYVIVYKGLSICKFWCQRVLGPNSLRMSPPGMTYEPDSGFIPKQLALIFVPVDTPLLATGLALYPANSGQFHRTGMSHLLCYC